MTPLNITGFVLALCFLFALFIGWFLRRQQDGPKQAYKALLVRIIQCNSFSDLCELEMAVDAFYDEYYRMDATKAAAQVATQAIALYTAINQRTEEFTGYRPGNFAEALT